MTADLSAYQTKTISDTGNHYINDNVESALSEIGQKISYLNANVGYPKLTDEQKSSVVSLMNSYYSNRIAFGYEYGHTRDIYASGSTCYVPISNYYGGQSRFLLNCNAFVLNILMGRSVSDYAGKNADTYSNAITKAFDFGYYPQYLLHQKLYVLVNRNSEGNISSYHRYIVPDSDETKSYSYNTYYSSDSCNPCNQTFNSFMNANDLARELSQMGCEIPFSELDIGDMVFLDYPDKGTDEAYTRNNFFYKNIGHVAMVSGFVNGYPYFQECTSTYRINSASNSLSITRCSLNSGATVDKARAGFFYQHIAMCARFPIAWGIPSNVPDEITIVPVPTI